ncbi:MAG: hypothetical protein HYV28_00860 [Ignavibacteriales bacterium]|nr:hypothetical protein [Ignavibacteriales bacterium]
MPSFFINRIYIFGAGHVFAFLFFCMFPVSSSAEQLQFRNVGIESGLSQSAIITMMQDHDGFMWIGTWDGLNMYDGYKYITYRKQPGDTNSLYDNSILSVIEDKTGNIWVGTSMGGFVSINKWTGKIRRIVNRWRTVTSKDESGFYTLIADDHDCIWAFSNYYCIRLQLPDYKIDVFHYPPGCMGGRAIKDAKGRIWLLFANEVMKLNPVDGTLTAMIGIPALKTGRISSQNLTCILDNGNDEFLLGTIRNGIYKYSLSGNRLTPFLSYNAAGRQSINKIFKDSKQNLWIGTGNGLIVAFHQPNDTVMIFNHYGNKPSDPKSLTSNNVYTFHEDRSGIVWIGTDYGISQFIPERKNFSVMPFDGESKFPLPGALVFSVLQENAGYFWAGTTKGLIRYQSNNRAQNRVFTTKNSGLNDSVIGYLFKDSKNRLWIGSGNGLHIYNYETASISKINITIEKKEDNARLLIFSISEDSQGTLWLGTALGLIAYYPESGKSIVYLTGMEKECVGFSRVLYALPDGKQIWCGTDGAGLIRFFPASGKYEVYNTSRKGGVSLSTDKIFYILKDSSNYYIANGGGGIDIISFQKDGAHFSNISTKTGLLNNFIYGMLKDKQGNLWISSNGGLSKYNPLTGKIHNYTTADGLPSNECMQNGFSLNSDGQMYFSTVKGIVSFYPERVGLNIVPPDIALTDFSIFNESHKNKLNDTVIYIDYNQNMFSFSFASLCFDNTKKNEFAYMLEGFLNKWTFTGNRNEAFFTNIDPGEYVFRVTGTNNDGIWSTNGAHIRIIIVPPFYATTWFRLLAVLSGTLLAISIIVFFVNRKYRQQIRQIERKNELLRERQFVRDQVARDLHDDLSSTVSSVGLFLESAKQKIKGVNTEVDSYLTKSGELLNEAEESISDIVWYVSPKNDTLQSLMTRIRILNGELCATGGLSGLTNIESDTDLNKIELSEDVRRALYLIFKEAVKNTTRYARAKTFTIDFKLNNGTLALSFKDDGVGTDLEEKKDRRGGNGLGNIRKRAEEIGAYISFASSPGNGMAITLQLPVKISDTPV